MRILYITALPLEYNASSTLRNLAMIKGLTELGHEVDVLTAEPSEDSIAYDASILKNINAKKYYIPQGKLYASLTSKKDNIGFSGKIIKMLKGLIRNTYFSLSVYDPMSTLVRNIGQISFEDFSYDLMITSSDPLSSHLLGSSLKQKFPGDCTKWIQYWGDPILINIDRRCKLPAILVKYVEKEIMGKADDIVYVSPMTAEMQKKIYPAAAGKIRFIPPAYVSPVFYPKVSRVSGDPLRLGYFGDYFSRTRDILPLCRAVDEYGAQLLIRGNSDISIPQTNGIDVQTRLPRKKVQEEEGSLDILVCICNRRGSQIPGKVYHYAATNKHILVILDGEDDKIRNYLEGFGRFIMCNNNPTDIADAISKIATGNTKVSSEPSEHFQPHSIARGLLAGLN